jgi:transcriptional regulator with XRE-family HTH domain
MNERNSYFAAVFSRELDRWKKENNLSQEDFAIAIGLNGKNMITRYKKGEAYPDPEKLTRICEILGVDRSIFSPQTFFDKFRYSKAVRDQFFRENLIEKYSKLEEMGIEWSFWSFLWNKIPYTATFFPINKTQNEEDISFLEEMQENDIAVIYQQDLEVIADIQADVIEYTTMQLIKRVLNKRLSEAQFHAVKGSLNSEKINAHLDKVICSMILELSRSKNEEAK